METNLGFVARLDLLNNYSERLKIEGTQLKADKIEDISQHNELSEILKSLNADLSKELAGKS